jgi:hypothetical protein
MKETDRLALQLAAEQHAARYGAEHFKDRVKRDGWLETATHAARVLQFARLDLQPWQIPPCAILDNIGEGLPPDQPGNASDGRKQAAALLKRMLSAGVSRWHPDPETAIAEAERSRKVVGLQKSAER